MIDENQEKCSICKKPVKHSCPIRAWSKDAKISLVFHDKCFEKSYELKDGMFKLKQNRKRRNESLCKGK